LNDSIGGDPLQATARQSRFSAIDWIVGGRVDHPADLRAHLLQHSLLNNTTLVMLMLSMSMIASVAIARTGDFWAYAWLFAEWLIGCAKISFNLSAEKQGVLRTENPAGQIVAGLASGAVLGFAGYNCVASGDPLLILLSGICLGGLVGGTSVRTAGTPRFAAILMCMMALPYAFATLISPIPGLFLIGVQMPLLLFGLITVLQVDYRTLVSLYIAQRENRWLASHDVLTGLPNRAMELKCFNDLLGERGTHGADGPPLFTVFCLDLDGFKNVNDGLGHAAGDALLVAVAGRLRACLRDIDFLFRVGGDEFVILLPVISPGAAATLADRIIKRIAEPFDLTPESVIQIGISVGSASALIDGATADELLRSADLAMYEVKRRGKGGYLTFSAAQQEFDPFSDSDIDALLTPRRSESQAFPGFPLPIRRKSV
jgi:diguanylate cyclase (GGDEF)-like protein